MASGRVARAEQRLPWPHSHAGPRSRLAAAARQVVAGRTPSTLPPRQQDFPRAPLPWSLRFPELATRLSLQGHGGPVLPAWEKGRREKLSLRPGRELDPGQGPGCQRKTRGACSPSLHPSSDAALCRGSFAEWDPRGLSDFETRHSEQLGKTAIHLHLSSAGARDHRGNECQQPDTRGDLPSIRNKEENGETDQRDAAVCLAQSNVVSEAPSKQPTSAPRRLRPSSGFPLSLHHGDVR